ncbi:MAG: DNA-binding transcriptional regulator [Rhodopirellula sp.]|nr:DNA-binding transcriptional regulator [Rhodopirellula sp.]
MPPDSTSNPRDAARQQRTVVLLVDTSRSYGREIVRGVGRFRREQGNWAIHFKPHGLSEPPPPWLREARPDGVLARIGNPALAKAIVGLGVPAVDLRGVLSETGLPSIGVDHREVARLAARHLLQRGFVRFGFCGLPRGVHPHMDELCDHFVAEIEAAGHRCSVFLARRGPQRGEAWERQQSRVHQWRDQQRRISEWIDSLVKPAAVMACHDDRALQVLDACRRARVRVPEELAVISADNDEYLCEMAIPPLTSIDENAAQIGYQAALLLESLMAGCEPPPKRLLVAPRGVVTRQSTDFAAIEDRHVAQAMRFIREHACEGILPRDVVAQIPLSRVALASRFKSIVGRTMGAEIQRVRIRLARELLSETELPIKRVAHRAGFRYVEYMTRLFTRMTGQTPAEYRKASRFPSAASIPPGSLTT